MNRNLAAVLIAFVVLPFTAACSDEPTTLGAYKHVASDSDALPSLPPPFTAAETTALRESFDWNATQDLAIWDDKGRPALYYALILVGTREQADTLELARIYHDTMPLFPEELTRWDEWDTGIIDVEGDDHGSFTYAFIPGQVYNEIRRAALANESEFETVILREVPDPTAVSPNGYLDLDVLVERGCTFGFSTQELEEAAAADSAVGMRTAPLVGRVFRSLVRIGRAIGNAVRLVAAKVRLKRDFSFRMRVINSDPAFVDPALSTSSTAAEANILRRSWGSDIGTPLVPHGAMIVVRTNMGMTMERMNSRGEVSMRVPRDKEFTVFLRLLNEAAVITGGGLWDRRVKLYRGDFGVHDRSAPIHAMFDVRDRSVHELAMLTDARDFAVRQLHHHPRQAVVVDGPIDMTSKPSSTACWSFFGSGTTAFGHGRGWSLAGFIVNRLFVDFDMVLRGNDGASRGVVTHEYGHFLMCDMFRDVSPRDFGRAYGEVIQDTVANPSGSATDQARMLAEGWADFYASQVIGATNYFATPGNVSSGTSSYCDATQYSRTQPCVENNIGGPRGTFPAATGPALSAQDLAIGTFTTLMVDTFDAPGIDPQALNAGVRWTFRPGPIAGSPSLGRALDDEFVSLDGRGLRQIVQGWSATSDRLRFAPFYNSIASVLLEDFSDAEVCQMFALHEPSGDCTLMASVLETGAQGPPAPILGLRATAFLDAAATSPVVQARWTSLDPTATSSQVEILQGPTVIASADVPFAKVGTWTSTTALPFNAPLVVRLASSLSGGAMSAYVTTTLYTPPEPVHLMNAYGLFAAIGVNWTATAATSYAVKLTKVSTGAVTWTNTTNSSVTIQVYEVWEAYKVEVYSVNAVGDISLVPSPISYATSEGLE